MTDKKKYWFQLPFINKANIARALNEKTGRNISAAAFSLKEHAKQFNDFNKEELTAIEELKSEYIEQLINFKNADL